MPPEIFYGIGTLILALVIGWAILRNKRRNKANDRITEQATRAEYEHPESYDRERERLKKQLQPER